MCYIGRVKFCDCDTREVTGLGAAMQSDVWWWWWCHLQCWHISEVVNRCLPMCHSEICFIWRAALNSHSSWNLCTCFWFHTMPQFFTHRMIRGKGEIWRKRKKRQNKDINVFFLPMLLLTKQVNKPIFYKIAVDGAVTCKTNRCSETVSNSVCLWPQHCWPFFPLRPPFVTSLIFQALAPTAVIPVYSTLCIAL